MKNPFLEAFIAWNSGQDFDGDPYDEMWVIAKGYIGNNYCLWKEGGNGYTSNLVEARIFTQQEALAIIEVDYQEKYKAINVLDMINNMKGIKLGFDSQFHTERIVSYGKGL